MSILNYFSTSSSTSRPWKQTCYSNKDSSSSSDCGNTSESTGDENSESSGSKASDTVSELFTTSSRKRRIKRILSQAALKKGKTWSRPQGKVIVRFKESTKRGFNKKWLTEYPWLQYDCSEDLMYCKYCKNAKVANAYAAGTKNFRNTNLLRHVQSSEHQQAILIQTTCETIEVSTAKVVSNATAAVTTAMRNVYWLAKEEVATFKYSSLNALLALQGCQSMRDINVGRNAQYSSCPETPLEGWCRAPPK